MSRGVDSHSHNGDPIKLSEVNDLYKYYKSAQMLAKTIEECATPFVVGIYGRWGRGKSTFLNTIESELDRETNKGYRHHKYTPWNYHLETFNDVWISMILELASGEDSIAKSLKDLIKKINFWRTAKSAFELGADLLPGGALIKSLLEKIPDEDKTENEYGQFIKAKKSFDEVIEKYRNDNPNGRVFIYRNTPVRSEAARFPYPPSFKIVRKRCLCMARIAQRRCLIISGRKSITARMTWILRNT